MKKILDNKLLRYGGRVICLFIFFAFCFYLFLLSNQLSFLSKVSRDLAATDTLTLITEKFVAKEEFSFEDIHRLRGILLLKKENDQKNYLTEDQRRQLADNAEKSPSFDLMTKFEHVDLFKYLLGLNNIDELERYLDRESGFCAPEDLFLTENKWNNDSQVGAYFDVLNFCRIPISQSDKDKLAGYLNTMSNESYAIHLRQHGINDVPVYVNDCSPAKDENERYHCLFFN